MTKTTINTANDGQRLGLYLLLLWPVVRLLSRLEHRLAG